MSRLTTEGRITPAAIINRHRAVESHRQHRLDHRAQCVGLVLERGVKELVGRAAAGRGERAGGCGDNGGVRREPSEVRGRGDSTLGIQRSRAILERLIEDVAGKK